MIRKWMTRTVPPQPVHLDVNKKQVNVRSSIVDPFPGISTMNFKFVYTDYEHLEIDGNEVGATFDTNGVDSRLELVHKPVGIFQGSIGGQFFLKDLSDPRRRGISPADAHYCKAPPSFLRKRNLARLTLQVGGRVEHDHCGTSIRTILISRRSLRRVKRIRISLRSAERSASSTISPATGS